jgi:hypothetical protein
MLLTVGSEACLDAKVEFCPPRERTDRESREVERRAAAAIVTLDARAFSFIPRH